MVLVEESSDKLAFRFNSKLWVYLTLSISIVLGIATYFAFLEEGDHSIVVSIFGLLTLIFLYSSIYSFKLHRSLELEKGQQIIRYVESSLYKNIAWQKGFQDFQKIKSFRPITTAGSGGAKQAKSWTVELISKEGETYSIGYNQFGALNRLQAEKLVSRVADMMSIQKDIVVD